MASPITGNCPNLIKALTDAGIIPDLCQRVIIDVRHDDIVKLYYECLGDTRLYDIDFAANLSPLIKEIELEPTQEGDDNDN